MPLGEKTKSLWKNPEYRKHMSEAHKGQKAWNKGKHPECVQGSNNPAWKGGKTIDKDGYILIYQPKHPFAKQRYVKRSRFIMEKIIERYLTPEEVVHHKGLHFPIKSIENRQDDRLENLKLFKNKSEHMTFHCFYRPRSKKGHFI